mmetsp:Transcript_741/g.1175  ORF Transcript_741/g.1175 Transcript_741/m.1175 type:complete len:670 (+) Transcript_741:94-2103(+)
MASDESAVQKDVRMVAEFFIMKHGGLEEAMREFSEDVEDVEIDPSSFERMLRKMGVQVDDPHELFDHIDIDGSGRIQFDELFAVLQAPMDEVKRKEELRQATEVHRIYQELAHKIHKNFDGSTEKLFKAVAVPGSVEPGHENKDHLSKGAFKRLLDMVGMELSDKMRECLFNKIDGPNGDGAITLEELDEAISDHLARSHLVALAEVLVKEKGSVAAAFDTVSERRQTFASDGIHAGLPPVPPNVLQTPQEFERVLRRIKLETKQIIPDVIKEPGNLFKMLQKRMTTVDDFKKLLTQVHDQETSVRKEREEMRKRAKEAARRRKASEKEGKVKRDIEKWKDCASKTVMNKTDWMQRKFTQFTPEDETIGCGRSCWETEARAGKAQVQLKEYMAGLQDCIRKCEDEITIEKMALDQQLQHDYWDTSPMTPYTQHISGRTPFAGGDMLFDQTSRQQQRAVKSDYLIQAASSGDVTKVRTLLQGRANVNTAAWGGVTALMAAARHGREAVVRALVLDLADPTRTDLHGRTAVDHARCGPSSTKLRITHWLQSRGALSGQELSAQVDALGQRFFDVERQLKELQARKKEQDSHRQTVTRTIARMGYSRAAKSDSPDVRDNGLQEQLPSFGLPDFQQQSAPFAIDSVGYPSNFPSDRFRRPPAILPFPTRGNFG